MSYLFTCSQITELLNKCSSKTKLNIQYNLVLCKILCHLLFICMTWKENRERRQTACLLWSLRASARIGRVWWTSTAVPDMPTGYARLHVQVSLKLHSTQGMCAAGWKTAPPRISGPDAWNLQMLPYSGKGLSRCDSARPREEDAVGWSG